MKMLSQYFAIGLILLSLFACDSSETNVGQAEAYIPLDATSIFELNDLPSFLADIKQNQLLLNATSTVEIAQLINNTPFLSYVNPSASSVIAFTKPNDSTQTITLITREHPMIFVVDSIDNAQVETQVLVSGDQTQKIIINNKAAFYTLKDSLFIASNSEVTLRQILEGNTLKDSDFEKIARVHNEDDTVVMSQTNTLSLSGTLISNFASWTSAQVEITSNSIHGTGVVMAVDSTLLLDVFKGQIPQQNDLELLIPSNALSAHSFTFSDATLLQNRIRQYRNDTIPQQGVPLFDSVNEIGVIELPEGMALVLKSIDPVLTQDEWAPYLSATSTFKEVAINNWSAPELFTTTFSPLIPPMACTQAFQIENYYVFTENEAAAERIITAHKNNSGLSSSPSFKDALNYVSNASSLLLYELQNGPELLQHIFSVKSSIESSKKNTKYPLSLLQYSYDRNFAHMHLVCQETTKAVQSIEGVSEQFSVSIERPIILGPQFFSNHRTKRKDVLVQDASNMLYLISDKGSISWAKKLPHPIIGAIEEIDILRNGKKQLVFSTKKALYVWDRNGNPVAPFPIQFKDDLTQPVSVFDYDNNRKYRFLVTQNNELFMYDSKGKNVKGFGFKKTESTIVLPPQHLRIGNKDYIAIAEQNGKLNLLSRTGKERIGVKDTFTFGEINIQKEGSKFLVITGDNQKKLISSTGKVTSETLVVSQGYGYRSLGNTKVSLDDNLLRINSKLVELPFGIYTVPNLFLMNRKMYITTTETQENKVYVYDKLGNLLPGFPVYGTGPAEIAKVSGSQKGILVKGDEQTVIFYSLR